MGHPRSEQYCIAKTIYFSSSVDRAVDLLLLDVYCIVLIVLTSGVQLRTKCLVSLCTRRYFIGDEDGTRGHASVCGGAEL